MTLLKLKAIATRVRQRSIFQNDFHLVMKVGKSKYIYEKRSKKHSCLDSNTMYPCESYMEARIYEPCN